MSTATKPDDIRLELSYDGPALATGRMDVRLLAAAMASTAQLIDDSTHEMFGPDAEVRIEVGGDFRKGSFTYAIHALAVAGIDAEAIRRVLQDIGLISGATGATVIGVLKWLRGRKAKVKRTGESIELHAGRDVQVVNLHVAQLVYSPRVRSGIEGLVAPLSHDGIEEMRMGTGIASEPIVTIDRNERSAFIAPEPTPERVGENVGEALLQVVSPVLYASDRKWQFAYPGETAFFAPVLDTEFMKRFRRREIDFLFGDLVRVELKTTVTRTEAGTHRTEREILKVYEKIEPPKQIDLFSDEE
ncbi:MAG: hypothetical protein HYV19_04305 [Gemmatimonadetes bacterium]|nr:hypothetical protein [Gemmatimonadota bacterium]